MRKVGRQPNAALPSAAETTDFAKFLLELARDRIREQAQASRQFDAKALGVITFSGVVVPIIVANHGHLTDYWWMSLIPIALSIILCFDVLRGHGYDFGPAIQRAYQQYAGEVGAQPWVSMVAELGEAVTANIVVSGRKSRSFETALWMLIVAFLGVGVELLLHNEH